MSESKILKKEFYLGVGIENCWMAQHDPQIRPGQRLLDVYLQMDHYRLWQDDLALAADLGVSAMRYSVPWYRSNPAPGVYDWSWIEKPLAWLREHDIEPIIDLLHYGTPLWMDNGVLNHNFPARLAEYAAAFATHFEDLIDHYTPHNEPQINALHCGYRGTWPPHLHGLDGWLRVSQNMACSVVEVSRALRAVNPEVTLISAESCTATLPDDPLVEEFADAIRGKVKGSVPENFDLLVGYFPGTLAYGKIAPDSYIGQGLQYFGYSEADLEWFHEHGELPDVFGINYYPLGWPKETSDVTEKYRELTELARRTYREFGLPLYISETSGGLTQQEKVAWIDLLGDLHDTMAAEGMPLKGLNWWPMFETIQWFYRDSVATVEECIVPGDWNNGLYSIEAQFDGTLKRVANADVVAAFRQLARRVLGNPDPIGA